MPATDCFASILLGRIANNSTVPLMPCDGTLIVPTACEDLRSLSAAAPPVASMCLSTRLLAVGKAAAAGFCCAGGAAAVWA